MARILKRLALLALPFAAFLVWFEVARGGRESNLFAVKRHRLQAAAPQVRVLCMGSSHAHDGILPGLVHPGAFNLAAVSQSLRYDCALVHEYAPSLPGLQLVVIPVSYFSLQSELDRGTEAWRAYYYFHVHGIPHRDWRTGTHARNWSAWFLWGRDHGLDAVRGVQPPLVSGAYDAAGGLLPDHFPAVPAAVRESPARAAEETAARHHAAMDPALAEGNVARLSELLGFLKERGVAAVFVTLPVSAGYRSHQRPAVDALTAAALGTLGEKHGVVWHDYSADPRFDAADFNDPDHLGVAGARKFSELLGREVVAPALARAAAR